MAKLTYKIVEHDGGWAYKVGSTFSETFPTHEDALRAAEIASADSRSPAPRTASSTRTPTANGTTSSPTAGTGLKPKFPIRLVSFTDYFSHLRFQGLGLASHFPARIPDMANFNPTGNKHDQDQRRRVLATQPLYRAVW